MSTIHQKICLCELFRNAFPPIISPIIINIIPNNIFPAFFIVLSPFILFALIISLSMIFANIIKKILLLHSQLARYKNIKFLKKSIQTFS